MIVRWRLDSLRLYRLAARFDCWRNRREASGSIGQNGIRMRRGCLEYEYEYQRRAPLSSNPLRNTQNQLRLPKDARLNEICVSLRSTSTCSRKPAEYLVHFQYPSIRMSTSVQCSENGAPVGLRLLHLFAITLSDTTELPLPEPSDSLHLILVHHGCFAFFAYYLVSVNSIDC